MNACCPSTSRTSSPGAPRHHRSGRRPREAHAHSPRSRHLYHCSSSSAPAQHFAEIGYVDRERNCVRGAARIVERHHRHRAARSPPGAHRHGSGGRERVYGRPPPHDGTAPHGLRALSTSPLSGHPRHRHRAPARRFPDGLAECSTSIDILTTQSAISSRTVRCPKIFRGRDQLFEVGPLAANLADAALPFDSKSPLLAPLAQCGLAAEPHSRPIATSAGRVAAA